MGVALTVLVVAVSASVSEAVRGAGGSELVDADIEVSARLPSGMNPDATRRILAATGSAVAVPVIQINTRLNSRDSPVLSILGVPGGARRLVPEFDPAKLRQVRPHRGTEALLLGQDWASELGIRRGDVVGLASPRGTVSWTVTGLIPTALPNGGAIGVVGIGAARAAFDRPGRTDTIYVQTPPGDSTAALEARLRAASGGIAVVGGPGASSRADEASLLAIRGVLIAVALLGVAAAALVVFVSWRLMLEDERRNISRFLLNGATLQDLAAGTILVMGAATLVCAAVGSAAGIALSMALQDVTQQLAGFTGLAANPTPSISPAAVAAGVGSAFAMTGAAWLFGIRSMRKVPIVEAFLVERPDLIGHRRLELMSLISIFAALALMFAVALAIPTGWDAVGLLIVVLCACVLAYFIPIGLASLVARLTGFFPLAIGRYLTAHSRRIALLTTTFGIGIAASIVLSGLILSFDGGLSRSVNSWTQAELFVRPGWAGSTTRDTRFPGSLQPRLAGLDGVERAGAWTSTMVEDSGKRFLLEAWDSKNTKGVVDLIVYDGPRGQGLWSALDHGEIAISQNMAKLRDLSVGNKLSIPTENGVRRFRIAAVVDDYLSERGAAIMSLPTFRRTTGDRRVESIQLALEPGTSSAAVAQQVRQLLPGRPDLVVATRDQMRQRVTGFFDSLVAVLSGLTLAIFALVILVAMTTTAALLSARGKFLGLSALCGASPRSVRRQLIAEALLIGGAAWLAGAPSGLLAINLTIGALSLVTGLEPAVVVPVSTLVLTLPLVLIASSAAVWIPARRLLPEMFNTLRFE